MNKNDRQRIINLIFETNAEIDEAVKRSSGHPIKFGKCYYDPIPWNLNINQGIYEVQKSFTTADGKQYNVGDKLSGASKEYEKLSEEEKGNFKECWGDFTPREFIGRDGKTYPITDDSPASLKRMLGREWSHLPRKAKSDEVHDENQGRLAGLPIYTVDMPTEPYGGLPLTFKKGGDLTRPDYWRITDPENPEKFFILVPITCASVDEFIAKNEWNLRKIQRLWKSNPVFISCKSNILPKYKPVTVTGELPIKYPSTSFDKEQYDTPMNVRLPKTYTGEKATSQELIKVKINKYLKEVFGKENNFYRKFIQKNIPPIVFDLRFLNRHLGPITDDKVQYQGLSYISYDSDIDFLRKIIARAKGVKYDFRILENETIDLSQIEVNSLVKIPVNARYDSPKLENSTITVSLFPEDDGLGLPKATGMGKNNYFKGKIYKYDHGKNIITIHVQEKIGTAKGNRWVIEYGGVDVFYQARAFNQVYKNWDIDKAISLSQNENYEDKSLAVGTTSVYNLDYKGIINQNPATTLFQTWNLNGYREGNQFIWEMDMEIKYGKTKEKNFLGQIDFKRYSITPNSIYNGGKIRSRAVADVDPNINFGNEFVVVRPFYDNNLDMRFNANERIPAVQFEELQDENKKKCVIYTIMDNIYIRQALEEVLDDFMGQIDQINPESALEIIDLQQATISESKDLVSQIIRRIKLQNL